MKINRILIVILFILIFWIKFLPSLIEVWEFKTYKFGGWTTCDSDNSRVVEAKNIADFNWLTLDWQLYTTLKNSEDCN